jgi:hypothetical protein
MKVQIITPYRVSHLQRYSVTVCGNITSVYLPLLYIKEQYNELSVNCTFVGSFYKITTDAWYKCNIHGVSKKFGEWYQKTNKTETSPPTVLP